MRILQTLDELWGLRVSDKQRVELLTLAKWGNISERNKKLHDLLDDPVSFAIANSDKQRHRNGSLAMAIRNLRNVRWDGEEHSSWFQETFGCRLVNPQTGDPVLRVGSTYVILETIDTLTRWMSTIEDTPRQVLRIRLIEPIRISPRVSKIYGHEVIIEQPMVSRYLAREGWRCWVHRNYREDSPGSKIGLIDIRPQSLVFRVEGFHDGNLRPFPFLINWCMDSTDILERMLESQLSSDRS